MNPEFLNFAVTPLYQVCPHLRGNLVVDGDSIVRIAKDREDRTLLPALQAKNPCLWGIGVFLGDMFNHPPLLSGIAQTLKEAVRFAEQFGFAEVDTSSSSQANLALKRFSKCSSPVVSKMKRQSGDYALAAWTDHIHYLAGADPVYYSDHVSQSALPDLVLKYGNGNPVAAEWGGDFIRKYIRKREAIRKIGAIARTKNSTISQVQFVHADHNESRWTKKKNWQRHRIIKVTDKYVFIDAYPFFGKAYLRQGWQARIIFMRILDRAIFERDGEYYHRSERTTYYSESTVRKRRWKCKLSDREENIIIELPGNDFDWAIRTLGIASWPATIEIIKKAFARKAMEHHPDRGGNATDFIQCKAAREFLLDMCDS